MLEVFFVCLSVFFIVKLIGGLGMKEQSPEEKQRVARALEEFAKKENINVKDVDIMDVSPNENITPVKEEVFSLSFNASDKETEMLKNMGFNEKEFLIGVEDAVEAVNFYFDTKNFKKLEEILSSDLFKEFKTKIDNLEKEGKFLKSELIYINSKKIENLKINSKKISVLLNIESQQINYIKNKDDKVIYGDNKHRMIVNEKWTFEREIPTAKHETFWIVTNVASNV